MTLLLTVPVVLSTPTVRTSTLVHTGNSTEYKYCTYVLSTYLIPLLYYVNFNVAGAGKYWLLASCDE